MVCLAVGSGFGFQGRNFVHEDSKAFGPDVIMLIVVVRMNAIGHGLRRPAFYNIGRYRCFVAPPFVLVINFVFGRSYKLHEGFV